IPRREFLRPRVFVRQVGVDDADAFERGAVERVVRRQENDSRREAVGLELVEELAGQSLVVLVETPNSDAGDTEDTGVRPCGLAEELGEVAGGERRTRAEPDER